MAREIEKQLYRLITYLILFGVLHFSVPFVFPLLCPCWFLCLATWCFLRSPPFSCSFSFLMCFAFVGLCCIGPFSSWCCSLPLGLPVSLSLSMWFFFLFTFCTLPFVAFGLSYFFSFWFFFPFPGFLGDCSSVVRAG